MLVQKIFVLNTASPDKGRPLPTISDNYSMASLSDRQRLLYLLYLLHACYVPSSYRPITVMAATYPIGFSRLSRKFEVSLCIL